MKTIAQVSDYKANICYSIYSKMLFVKNKIDFFFFS